MDDLREFVWTLGCGISEFDRRLGDAIEKGEPVTPAGWAELKTRAHTQWPEELYGRCRAGRNPWFEPRSGILGRLIDRFCGRRSEQ
jgi:hypothetical protein